MATPVEMLAEKFNGALAEYLKGHEAVPRTVCVAAIGVFIVSLLKIHTKDAAEYEREMLRFVEILSSLDPYETEQTPTSAVAPTTTRLQ